MISSSSCSRRVMSPFGVVQFAIHLVMCSFLLKIFFYFYLVQSHFVVFQPFPSHILCLWLSLDFSQTDKLISFIHTWSFSLSSPRLDFFFFPSDIPLPSSWLAVELCFMKTVKTWKAGARWRWGGGQPANSSDFHSRFFCHCESRASALGIPSAPNRLACFL